GYAFLRTPGILRHSGVRTLKECRGLLAPLPGCDSWCVSIPGVRKKRVPLANLLAPLRGAMDRHSPTVVASQLRPATGIAKANRSPSGLTFFHCDAFPPNGPGRLNRSLGVPAWNEGLVVTSTAMMRNVIGRCYRRAGSTVWSARGIVIAMRSSGPRFRVM